MEYRMRSSSDALSLSVANNVFNPQHFRIAAFPDFEILSRWGLNGVVVAVNIHFPFGDGL